MCGYRNKNRTSAPIFRNQLIFCQFLFHTFDICTWFINLIDCNNNFNSGSFCMIDCFYCLRHYSVVCRYDKNGDIRRACTAHTHCRKRLMSRRVEERNFFSVCFYNICSDMLSDTTCFTIDHI